MESSKAGNSLFDVYLRLRPSYHEGGERFLDVEEREEYPKHITIKPPANDYRKRAVERFAFTRVFEEASSQLDLFQDAGVLSLVQGVLGTDSSGGRDGLLATLGVTGSGKVWQFAWYVSILLIRSIESHNPRVQDAARSHPACPRSSVPKPGHKRCQFYRHHFCFPLHRLLRCLRSTTVPGCPMVGHCLWRWTISSWFMLAGSDPYASNTSLS